jgi:hypothetical protein
METLFSILPAWIILVLAILLSFVLTYIAFKILRKIFTVQELEKFKDVTGIYVSMIGILYGVFLAFIVIAIWENYDHVKSNIDNEADALSNIYRDAKGLPPRAGYSIDSCAKQYVVYVVESEWAMMAHNKESKDAMQARNKLQNLIIKFRPQTLGEQTVYAEMISNLNQLSVARRSRVNTATAELPLILWAILIGGGMLLIFYSACFYIENQKFHLWLAFGVSGLIAILLFVALELNYPFVGSGAIKPDSFQSLKTHNIQVDTTKVIHQDSVLNSK